MTSEDAWQLLQESRKKIDEIDVKLVELLSRRAGVVEDIASAKRILSKEVDDPSRREQVLAHARAQNAGPLSNEELTSIFERIIDKMSDHQVARLKTGRS
jgi:chorismate mutase